MIARAKRRLAYKQAKVRRHRGFDYSNFEADLDRIPHDGEMAALFLEHGGRFVHKWGHYLAAYDEQFSRFREGFPLPDARRRPLKLLEIGVSHGGSLELWRRYFGRDATIFGIDIDPACRVINGSDVQVRIGSQADPNFLRGVVTEMGGIDLVVDDGSHRAAHQQSSLETLFPLLADGGLYVVEDTHTAYWRDFGGGRRRRGFLGLTGRLIDDMHGWYHPGRPNLPIDALGSIPKVTIYDSMVAIEKKARERPVNVKLGSRSF